MTDASQSPLSTADHLYLERCLYLARMGSARVFPNPQVGAVLVHQDTIIGEGYHAYAGGPHAEVKALEVVHDRSLLAHSTMYVSLEPCSHHGKTPPCVSAIILYGIPRVVIGCLDPNPQVSGRGVQRLREAGIQVDLAPFPDVYQEVNRAFFCNQQQHRPWIILKWAESADGFIAGLDANGMPAATPITGREAGILVHKLRSQVQAIMVGRRTAQIDNPRLNTRHFFGENPVRIVFDRQLRLPVNLQLLNDGQASIVLNESQSRKSGLLHYYVPQQWNDMRHLMEELYGQLGICSILIEGGVQLLQQFIDQGVYDEIWKFSSLKSLQNGLPAPVLPPTISWHSRKLIGEDLLYCAKGKE